MIKPEINYRLIPFVILFSLSVYSADKPFSYKRASEYKEGTAIKFLTGLMLYEREETGKSLAPGFFVGTELELPVSIKSSIKVYIVPEVNYWIVQNTSNIGLGTNFRTKLKTGKLRPYVDLGATFNIVSTPGNRKNVGGLNIGIGLDIPMNSRSMAIVIDLMSRIHVVSSRGTSGFSLTPGLRISF